MWRLVRVPDHRVLPFVAKNLEQIQSFDRKISTLFVNALRLFPHENYRPLQFKDTWRPDSRVLVVWFFRTLPDLPIGIQHDKACCG